MAEAMVSYHLINRWLTVRDLSSLGRSHRVYGHKTKRTHHLLSDLELAIFLILEWNPLIQGNCPVKSSFQVANKI